MAFVQTGKVVEVLNINEVQKELKDFAHKDMPLAVARGFSRTAKQGVITGKRELTRGLTMRSKWVLNGVKGTPLKPGQMNAFQRSYQKYGIADGSIYIRGATREKNDLGFLLNHETGKNRRAHNKFMSIPLSGLRAWKKSDYRTSTGRTKKRMKPSQLLGANYGKEMKKAKEGSLVVVRVPGASSKKRKRRKGGARATKYKKPFVMNLKTGGKNKGSINPGSKLLALYKFKKITRQNKKISFGDKVETKVLTNLRPNTVRQIRRLMPKS